MATNYSSEEEDDSQNLVTCENCLEYEGYILDPRTLPCQHVFCVPCLDGQRRKPEMLFCAHKDCLREHDVTIDMLPSALGVLKMCCDTCAKKKGEMFMTANVYCVQCEMKYCDNHHKAHDELNTHKMMRIKEYLQSSFAHELCYCDNHRQEAFSLGCPDCSQVFCVECVNTIGLCHNGSPHKLVSLNKLSDDIKDSVEPLKKVVEDKFDDISVVIKETTIILSEWDIETDEGVRLIRKTRDEQLGAIEEQYTKLEQDYVRSRKSSKEDVTDYLAQKAAVIQSEYLTQLKKLRTDLSYRHPVDVVNERLEIEKKIAELKKIDFPKLVLQNQVQPTKQSKEKRAIEIELLSTDDVIIGDHITLPPKTPQPVTPQPITPPTGLQLVNQLEVTVRQNCLTVCHYNGYTYLGLNHGGGLYIIDEWNVTSKFVKATSCVFSIRAHNDRLYTLVHGNPYKLCVYDLTGQLITSWDHPDTTRYGGSKLSIIRDQLVVVDVTNQRITLYTLNGDLVRHIPCPLITKHGNVSMCAAGDDAVILTNKLSSKVFRQSLRTGDVDWVSTHVQQPRAAVCLGGEYVLVASRGRETKLWILRVSDGEYMGELADQTIRDMDSSIFDLYINGDILIVPRFEERTVSYYILRT